jgi:hypothetical protein
VTTLRVEPAGHLQAAEARHLDVEEDQVARPVAQRRQRRVAVGALAHDGHVRVVRQQLPQPPPPQGLVIHD